LSRQEPEEEDLVQASSDDASDRGRNVKSKELFGRFDEIFIVWSYPHPVRNHNPHQICLKLYFSTLLKICQIQKRQSNCRIAFNISKLLSKSTFVNLPKQELHKITRAVASVASMDQNIPLSKPIFLNQRSAVNDINFQQTLQRQPF